MSDTSWSYGWTFYKTGRTGKPPADDDLSGRHPSIQAALLHSGIDGDLLEECLQAAEAILES